MIAKAGSSTCRYIMKHSLGAIEKKCRLDHHEHHGQHNKFRFSMVREPTSRFYSSYQEAFYRNFKRVDQIPTRYRSFLEPFSNLTRRTYSYLVQQSSHSTDNLTLALETFVRDYDAHEPFDGHLRLQIPRLTNSKTGRTISLNSLYDSNNMNASFEEIGTKIGIEDDIPVVHAYDRGNKRMNFERVSYATQRKICQLSAIDYCCLNYELPPQCEGAVKCQWVSKPKISNELLIEPKSPYPP
jgi:hypothetical protein